MKIKLTRDVPLVDGSIYQSGLELDVLEDKPIGPFIDDDYPEFCSVFVNGQDVVLFSPEFVVIAE